MQTKRSSRSRITRKRARRVRPKSPPRFGSTAEESNRFSALTARIIHGEGLSDTLASGDVVSQHVSWSILEKLRKLVVDPSHRNEFSGTLHTSEHTDTTGELDKGEHIQADTCSHEYAECLAHANITRGEGDSAQFFDHVKFTYHTHPQYYYTHYGVKIAPPSGEDIGVFLRGCAEGESRAHLVLSVEGVYVMIANPCFVRQARNLLKLGETNEYARAAYNVAMIGAEILGMETHECRTRWTPKQWLEWIRGRFVCRSIEVRNFEEDIRSKFSFHCRHCPGLTSRDDIGQFQALFKNIVRTSFELAACSADNPVQTSRWAEGNWLDVNFVPWKEAKDRGILLEYVEA